MSRAVVMGAVAAICAAAGATIFAGSTPPANPFGGRVMSFARAAETGRPVYYQDPDGKPFYSPTPKKTPDGRDYVPVHKGSDLGFDDPLDQIGQIVIEPGFEHWPEHLLDEVFQRAGVVAQNRVLQRNRREIVLETTVVDDDFALAGRKGDAGDGAVTEEAVHPFDNLGDDLRDQRRMGRDNHQIEDSLGLLAGRKADRFGTAHPGVLRADDLGPARDHAGLHETEAAEGGAADFGDEVGDRRGVHDRPRHW